jgi:hypothetical protein
VTLCYDKENYIFRGDSMNYPEVLDCDCGTFLGIFTEKGFLVENMLIPLPRLGSAGAICGDCGKELNSLILERRIDYLSGIPVT